MRDEEQLAYTLVNEEDASLRRLGAQGLIDRLRELREKAEGAEASVATSVGELGRIARAVAPARAEQIEVTRQRLHTVAQLLATMRSREMTD
jgi:hypothetical protein